jgi:hypothetical protein
MHESLKQYSREELENKLLHMTSFIAYKLSIAYMELSDPLQKVIRTDEAEIENTHRVIEHMICVFPALDILFKTHPSYDVMKEWIETNHKQALLRPCSCDGCKQVKL